jgi:hypothetical protein
MKTEIEGLIIAEEVIISKIYNVRGKQVIIDDLLSHQILS